MNDQLDKLLRSNCQQLDNENLPMNLSEIEEFRKLVPHWQYCATENALCQTFRFENYSATIKFVNQVANVAEQQDHHPELIVSYNRCKVNYVTHSVNGITLNDFICAAKIDQALHQQ